MGMGNGAGAVVGRQDSPGVADPGAPVVTSAMFEEPIPQVLTIEYVKQVFVEAYAARKAKQFNEVMKARLKKLYDIPYVMTFLRDEREKMRTSPSPGSDLFGALHQQSLTGDGAQGAAPLTPGATTPTMGGHGQGTPVGAVAGAPAGTGLVPAVAAAGAGFTPSAPAAHFSPAP